METGFWATVVALGAVLYWLILQEFKEGN